MKGIGFKNMKAIEEYQWFDFEKLTLFVGTNNSGKSSVINAMQMLQDNASSFSLSGLLQRKFKIRNNLNKQGSIENFVNSKNKTSENSFEFSQRYGDFEYKILLKINKGLESFGEVEEIKVIDLKTNDIVFGLNVEVPLPNPKYLFHINYEYFVNRFYQKCENTLALHKSIEQLNKLNDLVNIGENNISELEELANKISKEFSIYVFIRETWVEVEINSKLERRKGFVTWITKTDFNNEMPELKIQESAVHFSYDSGKDTISSRDLLSKEEIHKFYKERDTHGIFNFSTLWSDLPEIELEFRELICEFYQTDFNDASRKFSNDLTILLSNTAWGMLEIYGDIFHEGILNLTNMTRDMYYFGLFSKFISDPKDYDRPVLFNHGFLEVSSQEIKSSKHFFSDDFLNKFSSILHKFFKNKSDYYFKLHPELKLKYKNYNFLPHIKNVIHEDTYKYIMDDIKKTIIDRVFKIRNTYVSSSRFTPKRRYSFNDNSDFTKLLYQIENLRKQEKVLALNFINKWLNVFEIADELILESDADAGTFKASLKNGQLLTSLADFGLGTNQLLPIIFSLSICKFDEYEEIIRDRSVVIEEPEANLHPAMQSKLANLFVDAINQFHVKILVETHSEYLIRKIQYLCAKHFQNPNDKETIKPEDVKIYYFNADKNVNANEPKVKELKIDNFGGLSDSFGNGFFDEATTLKFQLLKLNQSQQN